MRGIASILTFAFALALSSTQSAQITRPPADMFMPSLALSSTQSAQITSPQAVSSPPASLVSGTPAHGASMPVVSADGRRVAFVSRAPNLVTNPTSGSHQIFLRDLVTGSLTLVSATPNGSGGNDHSLLPAPSANGNLIAFESEASDLVADDTNGVTDIFVRDIGHRQTWPLTSGNGPSRRPMASTNGYVAFESLASDLILIDNNNAQDVFLSDVVPDVLPLLISVNMAGTATANSGSQLLAITPDGRFVSFWSDATDISPGASSLGEVYVRDVQNSITYCLTRGIQTYDGRRTFKVALTPDGAYAALQELNYAGPAPGGRVFHVNVFTGSITNIYCCGSPGSGLAISEDGTRVIFPGNNGLYYYESSSGAQLLIQDTVSFPQTPPNIASFLVSKDFRRLWFTRLTNAVHQLFAHEFTGGDGAFLDGLISTNTLGQPLKSSVISPFSISDAGLTVAYETSSGDVETNDFNVAPDIFVGNRRAALGNSRLISARHPDLPPTTALGHTTLRRDALNANGTRIAFLSSDSSLTLNDTNTYNDVFVRDFAANAFLTFDGIARTNSVLSPIFSADGEWLAMELFAGEERLTPFTDRGILSRGDLRTGQIQVLGNASFAGGNPQWSPSLSQDGRWLVVRDGDRVRITDLRTPPVPGQASNTIVDVGLSGPFPPFQANGPSSSPHISLDGEWVVFVSRASNLMPSNDGSGSGYYPPGVPQVFAIKFWQDATRLVSVAPTGSPLLAGGTNPVISANARFVAFETYTGSNIYRHDLLARGPVTNVLVCSSCSRPAISGDGRFVLYLSAEQVLVRDVQNGGTESIGAAGASDAILSIDGRFVAFVQSGQVYLHDRWTQATHLLSRNASGDGGNAPSSRPVFSHDGRTVAFQSFASDLVSGDYNRRRDIFIVRIQPVDTDSDGMDDDWEDYHFGSLAQNGSADVDADQHTNRQEFLAGTHPLDPSSVLRIRTSSRRSAPWVLHPELKWTSAPGRTYRLQYTPDLSLPWTDVEEFVTGGFNAVTPTPGVGLYRMNLLD